jgi:hypothetical protein
VELHDFLDQGKCPGLGEGVIPLHKKARPNTAQQTRKLCRISAGKIWNIIQTVRILAPSDSDVFAALKEDLSGYRFTCDEDVKRAAITWLREQAGACGFYKFIAQCDKYLKCQGDCVDK